MIAAAGWPDPLNKARSIVQGEVESSLIALQQAVTSQGREKASTAFRDRLAAYGEIAWQTVDATLTESSNLNEAQVARAALAACPADAAFFIGNSLPIREVNLFCRAQQQGPFVITQRGLCGIDGLVSGAAGAALKAGRPTVALLGDISFQHDLGGLDVARALTTPLVLCVVENGGGRIFEQLPVAQALADEAGALAYWTTPRHHDIAHAARLFDVPFQRVHTPGDLSEALERAAHHRGCSLIAARVASDSARSVRRSVQERLTLHLESAR